MHNILITGGSGFIGHHLVKRFLEKEDHYKISVVDNLSNNNKKGNSYQNYKHKIFSNQIKYTSQNNRSNKLSFYNVDIRDKDTILRIIDREKIDTCIHLAAKVSVHNSVTNPHETIDTNIKGTLNLLEACSKNKVK